MARIRTIKPELFRHEELYNLEIETGLPIRIAWAGLFTVCDREGRFRWKPRELKLDILPYDDLDFTRVLHAFVTRGFVVKYSCRAGEYGCIPSFSRHQVVNHKERASELPSPEDESSEIMDLSTREPRVDDACGTRADLSRGEGKGKEGKGTGKEGKVPAAPRVADGPSPLPIRSEPDLNGRIWQAYRDSFLARYGLEPLRNAKVNAQISQLAKRLGGDAPLVVEFYVRHNKIFYVGKTHEIGLCLADAESLHTQWQKGKAITNVELKRFEKAAESASLDRMIEEGKI